MVRSDDRYRVGQAVATVGAVPDEIFAHPMLARIYDVYEGDRDDLGIYVDMVDEFRARRVLDIGCGTGSLSVLLARLGVQVTGVDPAAASLAVARAKGGADHVTWVHGDATTLPPLQVDMAVMTGNAAQVFLTDREWLATLHSIGTALKAHGHLVFETRRPERRAWQDWATDTAPSKSTLRFRDLEEIEESLASAGFTALEVRDAPDRPEQEYVVIAGRRSEPYAERQRGRPRRVSGRSPAARVC
jgi:SAM-dependent methyltransferase